MSDPTTAETPTMRERDDLIQVACMAAQSGGVVCPICGYGPENTAPYCSQSHNFGPVVDAVVNRLNETQEMRHREERVALDARLSGRAKAPFDPDDYGTPHLNETQD